MNAFNADYQPDIDCADRMSLLFAIVMVLAALLTWWLSGFDSKLSGNNTGLDLGRRGLRCGVTLLVFGIAADQFIRGGVFGGFIAVLFVLPLTPFWLSCLSEISARSFTDLVHGEDSRPFAPEETKREMDQLAALVKESRYDEAIQVGKRLLESPEASTLAIETTLLQIYAEKFSDERLAKTPQFSEVHELCRTKHFAEATGKLDALLKREPNNLAAALLWMRIHAEGLHRPDLARARCDALRARPNTPPAFPEYARGRIGEWSGAVPPRQKSSEGIESLLVRNRPETAASLIPINASKASADELLKAGHLGSAIEALENQTRTQPHDFDAWMKLAEAYGVYCRNLSRAGKIIGAISNNSAFTEEQIQFAATRLKEWKAQAGF